MRTIRYIADDGDGATSNDTDATVTIGNQAPTDIALSNSVLNENINTASGVVVGALSATDPDLPGDTFSYAVIGGADAGVFSISGSDLVITDGVLDRESQASYQVTVEVTDSGTPGLTYNETFTITVNDLNENPTDIALSNSALNENVTPAAAWWWASCRAPATTDISTLSPPASPPVWMRPPSRSRAATW